jgi:hypothetical protein
MPEYSKDYYKILQMDPTAEQEVISAVYKRLVRLYHPDTNTSPHAHHRMREINEAYEILSNPQARASYDRWYYAFQRESKTQDNNTQQVWTRKEAEAHRKKASEDLKKACSEGKGIVYDLKKFLFDIETLVAKFQAKHSKRILAIKKVVSRVTVVLVIVLVVIGGILFVNKYMLSPISCRFVDGIYFRDRLLLKNTSPQTYHNIIIKFTVADQSILRLFPTWQPDEEKAILVSLKQEKVPRLITIDFFANEEVCSRYCYIKKQ